MVLPSGGTVIYKVFQYSYAYGSLFIHSEMTLGTSSGPDSHVFADQFVLLDRAQRSRLTFRFLFIVSSLNDSCCALQAEANSENYKQIRFSPGLFSYSCY